MKPGLTRKEINEAAQKVLQALPCAKGNTLRWVEVLAVVGPERFSLGTKSWDRLRSRLRELLLKRGITPWVTHGIGYYLPTAQEQVTVGPKLGTKRVIKQTRRVASLVALVSTGELGAHGRVQRMANLEALHRAETYLASQTLRRHEQVQQASLKELVRRGWGQMRLLRQRNKKAGFQPVRLVANAE